MLYDMGLWPEHSIGYMEFCSTLFCKLCVRLWQATSPLPQSLQFPQLEKGGDHFL